MNVLSKGMTLGLFLILLCAVPFERVHAAAGHENNCVVTEVSYGWGSLIIKCATGTINAAYLPGSVNLPAGCTLTSDLDSIKIWLAQATAARIAEKQVVIWYTDECSYARIIAAINIAGN